MRCARRPDDAAGAAPPSRAGRLPPALKEGTGVRKGQGGRAAKHGTRMGVRARHGEAESLVEIH